MIVIFFIADLDSVDVDDGVLFLEFPADQFPGRQDRQHTLNTGQRRQRLIVQNRSSPITPIMVRSCPVEMCDFNPSSRSRSMM